MHPLIIAALVVAGLVTLLVAFLVLVKLFEKPLERSKAEVIEILRTAADGRMDCMKWDDFVNTPIRDPTLDELRETCCTELYYEYEEMTKEEAESGMWFSNPAAQDRLRGLISALEADQPQTPAT